MSQATCPKCKSTQLQWVTMRKEVPFDLHQCMNCGHAMEHQDWMAPLLPLVRGRCLNCGNFRDPSTDRCVSCRLSFDEDLQVHDELRFMVNPNLDLLDAAREASRHGRRLIALKLATAAAGLDDEGSMHIARALRVWLLSAIGETKSALNDAKSWVDNHPDAPAMAWASYAQQLQHGSFTGQAADAYQQALQRDPYQHALRAKRAHLLLQLSRTGQAVEEVVKVLANGRDDEAAMRIGIEVAGELCAVFESQNRNDEIDRMLDHAEGLVQDSAILLAYSARQAAMGGDTSGAKRYLKKAKRLDPELEIYERIELSLRPAKGNWWRW